MDKPKEIVHFLKIMDRGGAETWLMHVLRHIDHNRFHFTFVLTDTHPGHFDEEIRSLGADIIYCPLMGGPRAFARQFKRILKETGCDIVHSHMHLFSGWLMKLAKSAQIPIRIVHSHLAGDYKSKPKSLKRNAYRWLMRRWIRKYATHGIGCSVSAADYLFTPRWRDLDNYQVATCAIDTSVFANPVDQIELRKSLGISPSVKIIGHVGRFVPAKNHDFLLRFFVAMLQKSQNIHLLLVGDGPLRTKIGELAKQLGITQHVTFMGVRDDVPVLMKNLFDLLLLPSKLEGLPVVIMESQSAGIPALISDSITREVEVIDELIEYESLEVGPGMWAERALEILKNPSYDKDKAIEQIEKSTFGISASVEFLSDLYSGKLSL